MRRYYLDHIRWVTVLLVVLYHVIFIYNSVVLNVGLTPFYETQYWDGVLYLLYPWFMVLLFNIKIKYFHLP